MNPPSGFWHRTRRRPSFWLGLFVACFLAWAWWDSYGNGSGILYSWGSDAFAALRWQGASFLVSVEDGWFPAGFQWRYRPGFNVDRILSAWKESGSDIRHCRVPDSLAFTSFVGLWVGWLAFPEWLWKRRRAALRLAAGQGK